MRLGALSLLALTAAAPAPISGPGYLPTDPDERGLWLQADEAERQLKTSNFLIRDAALNAYVRQVFCRTVGEACRDVRIYILRTPYFNASMMPNGVMQIWSGLFLRTRDEAQLAAVLGHEFEHYREKHSVQLFRNVKGKTNALAWLSMVPVVSYAAAGAMTAAQFALIGSVFSFSREMERRADAGSVTMLANGGYDPKAAARIWTTIRAERQATEAERGKKLRREGGFYASHPPSIEREATLSQLGAQAKGGNDLGLSRYRAALSSFWASIVDDQIKLNDFGATEYLLAQLAGEGGWTPELLYARGELYRARGKDSDFAQAAGFYRQATSAQGAPVEAWRGLGLSLLKAGDQAGGRAALKSYVERAPGASDKAMMTMLAGMS